MQETRPVEQLIGVISDTHGPLTSDAFEALRGVDLVVLAGDVMSPEVIPELSRIAPVTAVRGNMDACSPTRELKKSETVQVGGFLVYVLHDLYSLDLDPVEAGIAVVVHGHTHRAEVVWKDGVLYLNPGSAGSPKHGRPMSVALLRVGPGGLTPKIVELG